MQRRIEDLSRLVPVYTGEVQVDGRLYHTLTIRSEVDHIQNTSPEGPTTVFNPLTSMIKSNLEYLTQQGSFLPELEVEINPPSSLSYSAPPLEYSVPIDEAVANSDGTPTDYSIPRSMTIVGLEPTTSGSYQIAVKVTEEELGTTAIVEVRWPKVEGESLPDTVPKSITLDDILHACNPEAYHELVGPERKEKQEKS